MESIKNLVLSISGCIVFEFLKFITIFIVVFLLFPAPTVAPMLKYNKKPQRKAPAVNFM